MTETATFKEQLQDMEACSDAVEFVGDKTLAEAWQQCERGDWMLWLYRLAKNYDLQTLTLAKGHCANTVRHLMKDDRSKKAVDVAIAFGEGMATRDELNAAYAAAAAYAADADAASDAAAASYDAAAYAAYAAAAYAAYAAYAADAAACAATASFTAAAYTADARSNARKANQKATADICRKYLPVPVL